MARLLKGLPLSGLKTKPSLDGSDDRMYDFCPKQILKKIKSTKNLNKLIFNTHFLIRTQRKITKSDNT